MEGGSKSKEGDPSMVLLEETFYVLTKKNCVFRVRLTTTGLSLVKENDNNIKEQTIAIDDIIGCRCLRSKKQSKLCACQSMAKGGIKVVDENSMDLDNEDMSVYLYIYAYIKFGNKRERTIVTLRFRSFDKYEDNNKEAQKWRSTIKKLIKGEKFSGHQVVDFSGSNFYKEERRLLVLCNPKSGSGRGKNLFQQKIVPVLQEAEVPYDLHITKYANFAREFVRTCDIFQYSGILVVGGDGIVFEALNGLFERWDWAKAVKSIPIGVVPGGSGNGLARSIAHHSAEPYATAATLPSALAAVRYKTAPMDLVRIETTSQTMFSFLSVGWGFLADVDIESERLRVLGGQRFTLWSAARLIGLRSYYGKLWYIPAHMSVAQEPKSSGGSSTNLESSGQTEAPTDVHLETQTGRQRVDSWYSVTSRKSTYFSATESSYQSTADSGGDGSQAYAPGKVRMYGPASQLPCLTTPLPAATWRRIEGRFVMLHATYQSHLGDNCFFVPGAKLCDGVIWLMIVRDGISRSQLFNFLVGLDTAAHVSHVSDAGPVQLIPAKAFRLEPDPAERGYMTIDGERVEYGPVQAEVFPGLAQVMVP